MVVVVIVAVVVTAVPGRSEIDVAPAVQAPCRLWQRIHHMRKTESAAPFRRHKS